ncbi:hypothetical protein HYH03_004547 [Edaphochlamys debaryana]|uniref:Protein YIP n=1 Tax=Edaphochlamys debaryana TaxID=47281 RepID=A0A835YAS6_9CHLO|nr:hypothetical protein HYH03_004547 [Edaphochlamys debaryana]|eukprot:KAG2497391.1 hypothetical protein HYH03_004547 [Edaphochlamys debaryana]
MSFGPQSHAGAWAPAPGGAYGQPHMALQFTDTTAQQYVTGTMGRHEERQGMLGPGRSDDPGVGFAAPPGVPGAPPPGPGAGPGAGAGEHTPREDYTKYPFYNVRRYREYFDVDTKDVLWRVTNSMIGVFRPNFMEVTMKNPDLYGPFWTATTLIFIVAVANNFVSYIDWRKNRGSDSPPPPPSLSPSPEPTPSPSPVMDAVGAMGAAAADALSNPGRLLLASTTDDQWFTDYTKLGTSAAIFYGYVFIVGLIVFFTVKWFKGELKLANVFCIYGYCLSVYVPVSILCVIPIAWLQWLLVMLATALGAGFLFMNFKATIFAAAPARASIVLLLIVAAHVALGLGLKLYFFSY